MLLPTERLAALSVRISVGASIGNACARMISRTYALASAPLHDAKHSSFCDESAMRLVRFVWCETAPWLSIAHKPKTSGGPVGWPRQVEPAASCRRVGAPSASCGSLAKAKLALTRSASGVPP